MREPRITLSSVTSYIEQTDDIEISEIISAIIRKYAISFPNWEAVFLTLPKNDPDERKRMLLQLADLLQD